MAENSKSGYTVKRVFFYMADDKYTIKSYFSFVVYV